MNQYRHSIQTLVCTLIFSLAVPADAQIAFPGAQGLGAHSLGGRGGHVIQVTNLDDAGPGSLRMAVNTLGPRIVVFTVSGTIALKSQLAIKNPYITIAGQTAPGHGICIKDYGVSVNTDHVIIRYMRFRTGDNAEQETDALWLSGGQHIMIDHCSTSWGTDETLSVSSSKPDLGSVTVQWCMITESLNCSLHSKGCHGYGSLIRGGWGNGYSFHHNLYAHHRGRSPRPGNYNSHSLDPDGFFLDFRNNVVYDWQGSYAGYNGDTDSVTRVNFVGNYYVKGPESTGSHIYREQCLRSQAFFEDNWINHETPQDPWSLVRFDGFSTAQTAAYKLDHPIPLLSVETDDAPSAFHRVLSQAGVSFPKRDSVDTRIVQDVLQETGGLIDDEDEVGAWPELLSFQTPIDSDTDGMPEAWEMALGLDPNTPTDAVLDRDLDGYTNIEEYINWLPLQAPVPMHDDSNPDASEFIITTLAKAYVTRMRTDTPTSIETLTPYLTEDIQVVTSSGRLFEGKDNVLAILEHEKRTMASQVMTLQINSDIENFKWLETSAIVACQTTQSGFTHTGEPVPPAPQQHSLVFEQILGQWYITHAHTTLTTVEPGGEAR